MSIYHLHIPRTSGVYIRNTLVPDFLSRGKTVFASNRTKIEKNSFIKNDFVSGHFGWTPVKTIGEKNTFCIIRNPVERWISYINYITGINQTKNEINEKIDWWLYGEQSEIQSNLQSKFLTGQINIEKFNENFNNTHQKVFQGWFINNYSLNFNDIIENIEKINCFSLESQNMLIDKINLSIKSQYGFTSFTRNYKTNESIQKIKFSNNQIKRIKEINELDIEVYNYVKNKKY